MSLFRGGNNGEDQEVRADFKREVRIELDLMERQEFFKGTLEGGHFKQEKR